MLYYKTDSSIDGFVFFFLENFSDASFFDEIYTCIKDCINISLAHSFPIKCLLLYNYVLNNGNMKGKNGSIAIIMLCYKQISSDETSKNYRMWISDGYQYLNQKLVRNIYVKKVQDGLQYMGTDFISNNYDTEFLLV